MNTRSRIGVAVFFLAGVLAVGSGCNVGNEGERCNPNLSHDECGTGLTCTQPKDCPENYCCPTAGTSSNAFCQPGCNGGQASICAAGGDADCPSEGGD
ncbi:MAG TPA: hypothetical protein VGL81_13825 [Polyangiaceae bacterium]|jgi:hypothetical protein